MTTEAFEEYNSEAETPLKNLRNGAAGALRNLNVERQLIEIYQLSSMMLDTRKEIPFKTYMDMLEFH